MDVIDNFNLAVEQFLEHRINTFLFEINSEINEQDLSQSIDNLLDDFDLSLNQEIRNTLTEKVHDCIQAYSDNLIKKIYLKAFLDGLKFENKMEVMVYEKVV